ncbi:MAG TPA: UDP-2,4-diacetamido-2,4,6-trideoxy-beta-L-altropyranose hydrolase [Polyangia bacterium]|nr:UDP-2,4-diacetamido-2,4,6-trideoxy-beta-L-altropyranose hydrolase [Polyangia bacterium]
MEKPRVVPRLLIRADAGPGMGAGHVMRCLALAQAWQDAGGEARFAMASGQDAFRSLLQAENLALLSIGAPIGGGADAQATAAAAREMNADWLLCDGYAFGAEFQRGVAGGAARTALIDDNGECAPHAVDLILNQNAHARAELYASRRAGCVLLLGSRFALLRRSFRGNLRIAKRRTPVASRLLITLGAGDPDNVTGKVVAALAPLAASHGNLQAVIVAGAVNPHAAALERAARDCPCAVEIRRSPPDMAALMEWADAAIAAAGSTTWELLYMGVPTLSVIIADNQRAIARRLADDQVVGNLGWHADLTPAAIARAVGALVTDEQRRAEMSSRGRALVDGRGAERVVQAMWQLREGAH